MPNITPIFSRSWLVKMQIVPVRLSVPVDLAQRLAHQPRLEADVRVAHLALDLGPRHQSRHRVDHEHVQRAAADQHLGDLKRLLAVVGLRQQQLVDVDADSLRVGGVHGVLGVDERGQSALSLGLRDHVVAERGLARRLGAEHLDHATARQAADAEPEIEREGSGRDRVDVDVGRLAHLHDRALAELALDLADGRFQCLVSFHRNTHLSSGCGAGSSKSTQAERVFVWRY